MHSSPASSFIGVTAFRTSSWYIKQTATTMKIAQEHGDYYKCKKRNVLLGIFDILEICTL